MGTECYGSEDGGDGGGTGTEETLVFVDVVDSLAAALGVLGEEGVNEETTGAEEEDQWVLRR